MQLCGILAHKIHTYKTTYLGGDTFAMKNATRFDKILNILGIMLWVYLLSVHNVHLRWQIFLCDCGY